MGWEGEEEGGALFGLRFDPDFPVVSLDDALADGESYSASGVFLVGVESLEWDEDSVGEFGGDSDAVVSDGDGDGVGIASLGPGVDARGFAASELDGVFEEVLEYLEDLGGVGGDGGERVVGDLGIGFVDGGVDVPDGAFEGVVEVGGFWRLASGGDAGVGEEVLDQAVHSLGPVGCVFDVGAGVIVEAVVVASLEEFDEGGDGTEGFAEVVRGDVGEVFEVGV